MRASAARAASAEVFEAGGFRGVVDGGLGRNDPFPAGPDTEDDRVVDVDAFRFG